jgi:hypothetical protein
VLGPVIYLIYTSHLPTSDNTTTATFADDTAILAIHEDPAIASMKPQATINKINDWEKKWRIKINESKFKPVRQCKWAMLLYPPKRSDIPGHAS